MKNALLLGKALRSEPELESCRNLLKRRAIALAEEDGVIRARAGRAGA